MDNNRAMASSHQLGAFPGYGAADGSRTTRGPRLAAAPGSKTTRDGQVFRAWLLGNRRVSSSFRVEVRALSRAHIWYPLRMA